ncbi:hypothetical protein E3N88_18653 [Mikania micrantha]|uniref:Uncharacterized protein n=1 Tax=Mikania micrantha TaxID=192012 RepID=A0A5N6NNZ3_9ASTR|nr:hypothetical protein E3N88_18653 [Mikania micrantha]
MSLVNETDVLHDTESSDYNLVVNSISEVGESSARDTQPLFGELVIDLGYLPMRTNSNDSFINDDDDDAGDVGGEDNDEDDDDKNDEDEEEDDDDDEHGTGAIEVFEEAHFKAGKGWAKEIAESGYRVEQLQQQLQEQQQREREIDRVMEEMSRQMEEMRRERSQRRDP